MRTFIAIMTGSILAFGCGKGAQKAIEEEEKAEAAMLAAKLATGAIPKKIDPPVGGMQHVACETLIDPAVYTTALGEKEPMTVRDDTKKDGEATVACSLIRGGKKLSMAEQTALLKKQPRLGVLPGDPLCQITAYCWTIEDPERFMKKCGVENKKEKADDTMGSPACLQTTEKGQDDVHVYRFFDQDTKCIIKAAPEGSNIDNDLIRTCAKTARDTIGLAQIKPGPAAAPTEPEGSGSAAK